MPSLVRIHSGHYSHPQMSTALGGGRRDISLRNYSVSCSVILTLQPHRPQPARLLCPWNSLGKNTGVVSHSLLQGIFPTQRLSTGLLPCMWILYLLSHQGSPFNKPELPACFPQIKLTRVLLNTLYNQKGQMIMPLSWSVITRSFHSLFFSVLSQTLYFNSCSISCLHQKIQLLQKDKYVCSIALVLLFSH